MGDGESYNSQYQKLHLQCIDYTNYISEQSSTGKKDCISCRSTSNMQLAASNQMLLCNQLATSSLSFMIAAPLSHTRFCCAWDEINHYAKTETTEAQR